MYIDVLMRDLQNSHDAISKECYLMKALDYYQSMIARNIYYWEGA
jgi:hypothetical protein